MVSTTTPMSPFMEPLAAPAIGPAPVSPVKVHLLATVAAATATESIKQSPDAHVVFKDIEYNNHHPKSVAQLIALGNVRNQHILNNDELAAFNNDKHYFMLLQDIRKRQHDALHRRLHELRKLRAKSNAFKKRISARAVHPPLAKPPVSPAPTRADPNPESTHPKVRHDSSMRIPVWRSGKGIWTDSMICGSPISEETTSEQSGRSEMADSYGVNPAVYLA